MFLGTFLASLAICGGVYVAITVSPSAGVFIAGTTALGLATSFVTAQWQQRKQADEKKAVAESLKTGDTPQSGS